MRVKIYDPQRLEHVIEYDGLRWWGYDNIAHGFEPPSCRGAVIEAVLTALARNIGPVKVALPNGFRYGS